MATDRPPTPRLSPADLDRIEAWTHLVAVDGHIADPPTPHDRQPGELYWSAPIWNRWRAEVRALLYEVRDAREAWQRDHGVV